MWLLARNAHPDEFQLDLRRMLSSPLLGGLVCKCQLGKVMDSSVHFSSIPTDILSIQSLSYWQRVSQGSTLIDVSLSVQFSFASSVLMLFFLLLKIETFTFSYRNNMFFSTQNCIFIAHHYIIVFFIFYIFLVMNVAIWNLCGWSCFFWTQVITEHLFSISVSKLSE